MSNKNSKCLFIGIDPGINGAIAILNRNKEIVYLNDFPLIITQKSPVYRKVYDKRLNKKVKKRIIGKNKVFNFYKLAEIIKTHVPNPDEAVAFVEKVTAAGARQMGAASAFNFGGSFWAIQQALASHGISYSLVLPREWLSFVFGKNREKRSHDEIRRLYLEIARKRFKSADLKLKKDVDKAAALLIAEYCWTVFQGN